MSESEKIGGETICAFMTINGLLLGQGKGTLPLSTDEGFFEIHDPNRTIGLNIFYTPKVTLESVNKDP